MDIFLIRHGESVGNREGKLQGWLDSPLTEKGRHQAEVTANRLASAGIEQIYTSPLSRALDTARLMAERIGCEADELELLKEIDVGSAEGLTIDEVERIYPDHVIDLVGKKRGDASFPGGETIDQFHDRAARAWEKLIRHDSFGAIACVSHGWMINALLKRAQGLPLSTTNLVFANGAIQHLRSEKGRWKIIKLETVKNVTPAMRVWQLF
ncbi:MAG: histidine phosphatase family protein [Candidatus Glassbacteria bacterium]